MTLVTLRRLTCVLIAVVVSVLAASAPAQAQLPPTPTLPRVELPEPVADAVIGGIDTILPVISDIAIQARPVATAAGFALRMPCTSLGASTFVLALGSTIVVLPIPTGVFLGPALIFCSGSEETGPGDAVMDQVDAAVGESFEDAAAPVLVQVSSALDPAKPQLDEGCGVIRIFSTVPKQAPPPLHRLDIIAALCG